MTEAEWLTSNETYPKQLLVVQEYASIRKIRLIALVLVRYLQSQPDNGDAKRCDDLIEAVADHPRPWEQLEQELYALPGDWRFTHVLVPLDHRPHDQNLVVQALRKLVAFHHYEPPSYPLSFIHEIVGNPFRPVTFSPEWRTDTALSLARQMYDTREFSAMPILADALQDAGCDSDDVLNHCRDTTQVHVRGCWVCDLVLGKG